MFFEVDIAHIELLPTLWHECVPSRLTSVFVSAQLVNSSQFPLLPGPVSVFFNNSFTSTVISSIYLLIFNFKMCGFQVSSEVGFARRRVSVPFGHRSGGQSWIQTGPIVQSTGFCVKMQIPNILAFIFKGRLYVPLVYIHKWTANFAAQCQSQSVLQSDSSRADPKGSGREN